MERAVILTGGSIEIEFLCRQKISAYDYVICADHGLEAANQAGIIPDLLVGDFDSVDKELLVSYQEKNKTEILSFRPEKDDTDTELALHIAMERGAKEILVLGAFGTRLDHTLANIGLLKQTLKKGIPTVLCDPYNRMYLVDKEHWIEKATAFGDFITLLPFNGDVKGVTLTGFKYPLIDAIMYFGSSLGVSNELVAEKGRIGIKEGCLLVIESKD